MANIELDGANKKIKVDSGDLTLDVPGDIILDADGADLVFADGGTNILKITNSSSDVVFQPQVDAKDIIFKQYDGTTVATIEDNGTLNVPTGKLAINATAITSTAAELNIMDGVTATAAEINLIDGGTARGTTALADGDGILINDAGTMRMTNVTTVKTYMSTSLDGIDDQSSSNDDQITIADGEVCINEDSDDLDFRVESNSNTHAFFLDGQHNSRITCGASAGENAGGYTSVFTVIQLDDNPAQSLQAKKNNDGGPSFVFVKSRNPTVGSFTIVANNDVLGGIRWAADDGADTETQGAVIDARVDGTPGANDMPTRMGLMVTPDGANSVTERFRISQNGDLTASDTSIGSLSDQRLKDNIKDYTYDLETFKKYKPRTFDWKNPVEHSGKTDNRGFIAQEIKAVDDYWTYEYEINKENADYSIIYNADGSLKDGQRAIASKLDKTDAMYISVIQQLLTKVETLEARVTTLEG